MRKRVVAGILLASMMLSLTACTGNGEDQAMKKTRGKADVVKVASDLGAGVEYNEDDFDLPELDDEDIKNINASVADFSIGIMKETLVEEDEGANVLVSPTSIMYALAMAGNGADGENLSQFESVLVGGDSINKLNSFLEEKGAGDKQLSLANSIWIRNDEERIKVNDDFLAINKYVYDAETYMAPFNESTLKEVNDWVNDKTDGMIPEVLDTISDDAVMYLVNAAAFDAKWYNEYEDKNISEDAVFTNYLGEEEKVNMLHSKENRYLESDDATGFVKYYKEGKYAFVGMLPNEGVVLEDYINSLTGQSWLEMYENYENIDVYVEIPEFSYDYGTELNNPLRDMGLTEAFITEADFSKMASTSTGYLYIDKVIHKTHIEVDRNGTKAAAVTAITMTDTCSAELIEDEPKYVYLDRPFLYAIVETDTGLPVFMGTVNTCK